jgi:hypothetical protein
MTQSSANPNGGMSSEKNSGSKKWIIIAGLLLIVIVAILIWFLPMKSKYLSIISEKEAQRSELQNDLNDLMEKHNSIKAEYGALSDTLSKKDSIILANAKEIQELLNYKWEYGKVNKKLELLRKISQGYVHQLDSLYTVNRELGEENEKIRQQYSKEQDRTRELSKDKEKLNQKITLATVLKAYSISTVGVRLTGSGKEKETDKASKIERVKICFTLGENKLVEPGRKTIYVRIVRPDDVVVTQKVDGDYTFEFNGQTLEFTSKQEIDYQNKDTSTCIYWTKKSKEESAMVGTYNVFIYADGFEIGTSSFILK